MMKQDKYDVLFSELKNEFIYDPQQKKKTLIYLKTIIHTNNARAKHKKSYTPLFISLTSIVIAACLTVLFIRNPSMTSIIEHPSNEVTPPTDDVQEIFDVESFGRVHSNLTIAISEILSKFYLHLAGIDISQAFDPVKIDDNGVVLINFTPEFIDAFTTVIEPANPRELLHNLNKYVFSEQDVEAVHYLIDGNESAWNKWVEIEDTPITRAAYEASIANSPSFEEIFTIQDDTFYIYGVTINQTKQEVIERLGENYIEEKNIVIGGNGYYDRIEYEDLELTLIFHQNFLQNAYVLIRDSQSFDRYFETFTGTKKEEIVDEHSTSMENLRTIESNKGSNTLNARYDIYETLNIILSATSEEEISN